MIEWKDVVGYEGLYLISNKGDVTSIDKLIYRKGKKPYLREYVELKRPLNSKGYERVVLSKNGKRKHHFVHRLVAISFIENIDKMPCVNHKDENPLNNRVDNLEWCTKQYNTEYSNAKYWEVLTPDGFLIEVFNMDKFCRDNNLNSGTMNLVSSGKRSHHHGYRVWQLEDKREGK